MSESTGLLLSRSRNSDNYSTFRNADEYEYASDGRSVSSVDTHQNRFRLLSPDYIEEQGEENLDEELESKGETSVRKEVKFVLFNSVPITLTFFMEYSLTVTSLFIIGHVSQSASSLASVSLAVMTYNITGMAIIEGMATSLDTFCSQAYGAQKYTKVGLYFLRCSMMIMAAAVPIVAVWWTSAFWLKFLIPEHDLLHDTQMFLRIASFGLPGLIFFETGKRFLQAQGHYEVSTWALAITVPLNIFLMFTFTKRWGFYGAPIALTISDWTMPSALFFYCYFIKRETLKCWYPITQSWFHFKRVFREWKPMWKLAFPGLVMIESEYLSFEILTIMSSHFGIEAIAAQSVISNLGSLIYQLPFAMGCVVSTRVANYIGMELIEHARIAVKASYLVSLCAGVFNFSVLFFWSKPLAKLFTNDPQVIELAYAVVPILAVNQLYDSFNVFSAAILRGQARQSIGGILNIICYYFIALPLSGWFAFGRLHLEISGLWYGCGVGIFILALAETFFVYKSNWNKILKDFLDREANEFEVDLESVVSSEV